MPFIPQQAPSELDANGLRKFTEEQFREVARAWEELIVNATGVPEAPIDGTLYGRKNTTWIAVPVGAAVPSSTVPLMDGLGSAGVATTLSRGDHVHPSDTARVAKIGDTMTGDLTVSKLDGTLILNQNIASNNTNYSRVRFKMNNVTRWDISGAWGVETGGNAGSDFSVDAFNDAGTFLGTPILISRKTGLITAQISFTPAGTGAVTRTMQDKARDFVTVKDFGAVGDGVNDDTAEIQAAVNASRYVFMPPGTYLISGIITLPANTTLIGAGPYASVLVRAGTTQSYLVLNSNCVIEKIGMHPVGAAINVPPSTVPSFGVGIDIDSVSNWTIRDVWMEYLYFGIRMTNVAGACISEINIHQTYRIALVFNGGINDIIVDKFILHGNNTTLDALIFINNANEALMFSNGDVLLGAYSMFITAAAYTGRVHPAFCKFSNVYFDSSANGVTIDKADGFTFTGCWFSNSSNNGVNVAQADDTKFIGCDIVHNLLHGAVLATTNTKRTTFSGCNISANNVSNIGADGINVVAGVTHFTVTGCTLTNNYGTITTGNQRAGVNIAAGASDYYIITSNNVVGNVIVGINDLGTGTHKQIGLNLT